jgi:hypothetical protein
MALPIAEATEIPVGFACVVRFPMFASRLTFLSRDQLQLHILDGADAGMTETVDYRVINLRPGLFVVAWQEPMGTVVQVEDFAEGTVYSNITMVDQGATLVAISGTIHEITA